MYGMDDDTEMYTCIETSPSVSEGEIYGMMQYYRLRTGRRQGKKPNINPNVQAASPLPNTTVEHTAGL
jgi:hypothetical protein